MARDARTSAGGAAGTAADGADLHRPGRRTKDARSTRPPTTWTRRPRSLLPWTGGPRLPGLASGRSLRVILGGRSWAWDESRELALAFSGIGGLSVPGGLLSCRLRKDGWSRQQRPTCGRSRTVRPGRSRGMLLPAWRVLLRGKHKRRRGWRQRDHRPPHGPMIVPYLRPQVAHCHHQNAPRSPDVSPIRTATLAAA